MILVDTSIWIAHFRATDALLAGFLQANQVVMHPWIRGELAMGQLPHRERTLHLLGSLPQAGIAVIEDVLEFVERHRLYGRGIGLVDAQILASVLSLDDAQLWTGDRRLAEVARDMQVAFTPSATK